MVECLLIVVGGLLGSGHCVGMCGGFALTLAGKDARLRLNAARQGVYALGRVCTYVTLGAFAGFGGWQLGRAELPLVSAQAVLSLLAGALLVAEGCFSAGLVARPAALLQKCPGVGTFAALLRAPDLGAVFVAGCANGLLPCGLIYAYLALAASAGSVVTGAGVMALFGLGTVPALVLTGLTGSLLSGTARYRIFRAAAWCMILTGVLTLARGGWALVPTADDEPACPFCVNEV